MRFYGRLLGLVVLIGCAPHEVRVERPGTGGDVVVMVSFDGFRHDYLDRGLTPNFEKLAAGGVRADALIPVFPSKTFPNHHSIATGLYADRHGIVGNEFYDPVKGLYGNEQHEEADQGHWFGGEPIWATAERQGVRSAAFFWVASDFKVGGVLPSRWKKYDREVPYAARIDSVVTWLAQPEAERPRLVLLYLELMDNAGHRYGPNSPQVDSALVQADALLGRLMSGIAGTPVAPRTHLLVVSDHGMAATDPTRVVALDSLVDLTGARVVVSGAYSTMYFAGDTVRRNAVVATLRRTLHHATVHTKDSMPARFHWRDHPRIPDVLVLADDGWSVGPARSVSRTRAGGSHGYDPQLASMQGIFLALGPRVRPNVRIRAFENVHIHPFIAQLLGIQPAPGIDGRAGVLAPVLR